MPLTVIIPAGNEEENIERCVQSVIGWSRVVVICSGTDSTAKRAEKLGAHILQKKPTGKGIFIDIQHWINEVSDTTSTDWVMRLDADEVVPPTLKDELLEALDADFDAYGIPRDQYFWGGFLKGGDWYYDRLVRLWRKGHAQYMNNNAVHEQVTVTGKTGYLNNRLEHYSHPTLSVYIDKINRYTDLETQSIRLTRNDALVKMILMPLYVWVRWFFYHHGYRDGWRGFVAATMRAYYEFLQYAKYTERHHSNP